MAHNCIAPAEHAAAPVARRWSLSGGFAHSRRGSLFGRALLSSKPLGYTPPSSCREPHLQAAFTEQLDKRVDAKQLNFSSDEVAYPRLCYPEDSGCLRLCQPTLIEESRQPNHELRANPEILRLVCREAKVSEHVPGRPSKLSVSH